MFRAILRWINKALDFFWTRKPTKADKRGRRISKPKLQINEKYD
jgi:hypothetical protein